MQNIIYWLVYRKKLRLSPDYRADEVKCQSVLLLGRLSLPISNLQWKQLPLSPQYRAADVCLASREVKFACIKLTVETTATVTTI